MFSKAARQEVSQPEVQVRRGQPRLQCKDEDEIFHRLHGCDSG